MTQGRHDFRGAGCLLLVVPIPGPLPDGSWAVLPSSAASGHHHAWYPVLVLVLTAPTLAPTGQLPAWFRFTRRPPSTLGRPCLWTSCDDPLMSLLYRISSSPPSSNIWLIKRKQWTADALWTVTCFHSGRGPNVVQLDLCKLHLKVNHFGGWGVQ